MKAVLIEVDVAGVALEEGVQHLRERIVPSISQMPDFVSGAWLTGNEEGRGLSLTLWNSESAAQTFADQFGVGASPQAAASVTRCEVRDVAARA